jgi:hypothetical protein
MGAGGAEPGVAVTVTDDSVDGRLERLERAMARVERMTVQIASSVLGIAPDAPGTLESRSNEPQPEDDAIVTTTVVLDGRKVAKAVEGYMHGGAVPGSRAVERRKVKKAAAKVPQAARKEMNR